MKRFKVGRDEMRELERKEFLRLGALGFGALTLGFIPEQRYTLWGDGIHDDTEAFQAWADDKKVFWPSGERVGGLLMDKCFLVSGTIYLNKREQKPKTCCYCTFRFPNNTCLNWGGRRSEHRKVILP